MWHTLRRSEKLDPSLSSTATALLQSTSRVMIVAIGAAYLLCIVATAAWPEQIGTNIWLIAPVMGLSSILAFRLLDKHFLSAQAVWHLGLAVIITLAVWLFGVRELAFLYALLPFVAAVMVGWPAAVLSESLAIVLLLWLSYESRAGLTPSYGVGIILGGAFTGLLGWASTRALLLVAEWSLFSFQQTNKNLVEVRERRAELARLVKELDLASHSLERANHMLVLARAEAEEAKNARNRFVLAVSHELRTPLNFIIGFSELMVNSPDTYGEQNRWPTGLYEDIQEIHRSSRHLLRLVNDVLDLGQIESLQMVLLKDWVDPAQIVQGVEEMVRPAFGRKKLWFQVEIEPDLPKLFMDGTRIRQVLLNLVSNSLRLTERGGVAVHVRRNHEDVVFWVEDTGPGISSEDLPRIFEGFQQAGKGGWRRREGAGLGLSISRRFVELHGGRMWVESQVGEGSRFYFTLPLPDAARVPSLGETSTDGRYWRRLTERAAGERMLLALSPHPDAGEVIAQYVEGFAVATVPTVAEAYPKTTETLPSALLLDQGALQDGAENLSALPYDLPVISFPFPGSLGRPTRLPDGITSYLVKPIERATLLEAIEALGPDTGDLLIVDDDPAMVRFVSRALESLAMEAVGCIYQFRTALTGLEALAQLRARRPDAVLLDLALPDLSGWEVLKELQKERVPVIIMTAYDYPQTRADNMRDVLRVSMRRPLSRDELRQVLKCLLETLHPIYPPTADRPGHPGGPVG